MAIKTYYVTQNQPNWSRRLDDITPPWINIDGPSGNVAQSVASSPTNLNRVIRTEQNNNILYSTNGGVTWTVSGGNAISLQFSTAGWMRVQFVDDLNIYVMGTNGSVAKSTDGGVTFNMCTTQPTDTGLIDPTPGLVYRTNLHFITPLIGIATYLGKVRKTVNGGVTWTDLNGGVALDAGSFKIGQLHMSADQSTILAMSGWQVHRSVDAGATFTAVYTHPVYTVAGLYDMAWINDNEIWIMGQENTLVKSDDAGATWNDVRVYTAGQPGFFSGHFLDADRAFFGMSPFVGTAAPGWAAYSDDGGVNYVISDALPSPGNGIAFYPIAVWSTEIECGGFTIEPDPASIPPTPVGTPVTFDISVTNTGLTPQSFLASLLTCSAGITITSTNPLGIDPGDTGVFTLEYLPTIVESGSCQFQVESDCGTIDVVSLSFESLNIPECPHFNICITGPACAPDCITPGSVVSFDVGGTLSPVAYPTTVTFSVVDQGTNNVIFSQDFPVTNDTELQAILVNIVAPAPGHYCAQICFPGCNTIRRMCFDVCQPFDIYKDSCMHWHVHRPTECATCETDVYIVNIHELEGDTIVQDTIWDITQDNTFQFELPDDGIYIFEMKHPDTGDVLYSFSAFETCRLQECFKIMMDKIMCSCADPCCKNCNGAGKAEIDFARGALNKLVPLYLTYLGMARRNELYTTGMKWITDDQMCFLHDAGATLAKILDILMDCGCLCPEQKNTATARGGCSSC